MSAVCALAGWAEYQHYKHRDPSWIKLYRNLLTSEVWVCGTDDSRLVQVASLLLAARYDNAIPMLQSIWQKVASLDLSAERTAAALSYLHEAGFLQVNENALQNGNASDVLAQCYHNAMLEKSRGEKRRAGASNSSGAGEDPFA